MEAKSEVKKCCSNCAHYKPGVETVCALGRAKANYCLDTERPRFASVWFHYWLWEARAPQEKKDEEG